MQRWIALGAVAALAAVARGAEAPGIEGVRTVSGQVKKADAWKTLGRQGVLFARSQARWDALQKQLAALGWEKPEKHALDAVDFSKEAVVCVFRFGDVADKFSCHRFKADAKQAELHVVMSYIIYKSRGEVVERWNFILAAIPRWESLKVTVSTYHPMNGGPYPTPDKAQLEWAATFGANPSDIVDGLRGVIRAEKDTVKPGEAIAIEFKLDFDNSAAVEPWHYALKLASARVWDGKYSSGYRNHAFLVETPDGQSLFLRKPVQDDWDKNAPHPVEVKAGQPYVLPEWYEGKTLKSLKELGLDASRPGVYRITGLYTESAGEAEDWRSREKVPMWGGNIATNTVEVTVR